MEKFRGRQPKYETHDYQGSGRLMSHRQWRQWIGDVVVAGPPTFHHDGLHFSFIQRL